MTIRGPLDAERFRTTYYRQRWYVDPLPEDDTFPARRKKEDRLPAFSTVKKVHKTDFYKKHGDQKYLLDALRCATYVAEHKEHLLQLDDDGIVHAVAVRPSIELNSAGDRGTGVHAMLEALAKGQEFDLNWVDVYHPQSVDYYDVVQRFWAEQAPVIGFEEVVGMNWEIGYACTADATDVQLAHPELAGKHLAIDYKSRDASSNHGIYETEAMQLAAATFVEYVFVQNEDGTVVRQAPPKLDMGIIVSIKPDSYELYPVDLAQAWEGWMDTCEAWRLMKSGAKAGRASRGDALFIQPSVTTELEVAETATSEPEVTPDPAALIKAAFPGTVEVAEDPFAGLPDENGTPQTDRAKTTIWLRDRAIALNGIIPAWPEGVPTFKVMAGELHSHEQLKAIEKAINAAERAAQAPFPEENPGEVKVPKDDPRVLALVETVKGFKPAQLEQYKAATATIIGAKPTTGLCTYTLLAEYEEVIERIVTMECDVIAKAQSKHPGFFRRNDSGWVVDQEAAVVDLVGGKRELLKRGRAMSPGATIRNANEVLGDAALVAAILLEGA